MYIPKQLLPGQSLVISYKPGNPLLT